VFEVAVTYLLRATPAGDEVLLGRKLTGIGIGRVVGPGGKLEPEETAAQAAAREVREEVGIAVAVHALQPVARLAYEFPHRPAWSQASTAFLARDWSGEPVPSRELAPEWFPVDDLPLDRMWDDAKLWLPRALSGRFVRAACVYAEDNSSVSSWSEEGIGVPELRLHPA
jgi:8-oxo-dGTP diphosphatase